MAKKEISKQQEKNKGISEELLISVRSSLYKLKDYLDGIEFTSDEDSNIDKKATTMMTIIEKIGKSFETLAILEKRVAADEVDKTKVR